VHSENHPASSGALVSALVVRGKRQLVVYFTCIHKAFMWTIQARVIESLSVRDASTLTWVK